MSKSKLRESQTSEYEIINRPNRGGSAVMEASDPMDSLRLRDLGALEALDRVVQRRVPRVELELLHLRTPRMSFLADIYFYLLGHAFFMC